MVPSPAKGIPLIIKNTISSLPSDKTVFIISHRMSMLEKTDRIVTISEGRIIEYDMAIPGGGLTDE